MASASENKAGRQEIGIMAYFDYAATSLTKPPEVVRAVARAMTTFGNPSRSSHPFALAAARCVEEARDRAATLFGCLPERVAFAKNATEALNAAIAAIDGHIVTSEAEHNSVLRPLYRRGNFSVVPVDEKGRYGVDDLARHCRADTRAIVVAHASNLTGNVLPIADIGRFCRERELLLVVDAAQSAGLLDLNLEAQHIDALCFTGHKALYGPQGTGGICCGPRYTPRPLLVGGSGSHTFDPNQPPSLPEALEAGSQNAHGIAGLSAGMAYVLEKKPACLLARANALAGRFLDGLGDLPGIRLLGDYDAECRVPIVSLNIGSLGSAEAAALLAEEYGIAVRAGAHCAPLLHRRFGSEKQGALRFSFSHYNTEAEIDAGLAAVRAIGGAFI